MSKKTKKDSDMQGLIRLATEATVGLTDLVETLHKRIVHPPFLPSTSIQHLIIKIAGLGYSGVKKSTQLVGGGMDKLLGQLGPEIGKIKKTEKREVMRSVLNGILGDYLEEKENPLAINMQLKYQSETITLNRKSLKESYPALNGKILLLVHGSCMNESQWTQNEHNHGVSLAKELDKSLLYLHFNSGRHVSYNGQSLNELLEELVNNWPVPIEELVILAHSMGGLVARSAHYYGAKQENTWTSNLKKMVFLGTPHHGSHLERGGHYLDAILEAIPYAKPFARLGKIRSAGVTDLRYGNLIDEDWKGFDRFKIKGDQRQVIPLPEKTECYSIAAVKAKETDKVNLGMAGDGLVGLKSALGQHKQKAKDLNFKKENTWVSYESTHISLLGNAKIYAKIKSWLIE